MAEAAAMAQEAGADIIDINMGCPASNVTGGLAGSALLRDVKLAESCVKSIVAAINVPVTVKMRVGWDERQKEIGDYLTFLKMFEANGIAAVTLHPRTRSQQFTGRADWSCIARAADLGLAYPIIGNGDVLTCEDAERMVHETGCSGVMVGRGALYNPFLFVQIMDDGFCVTHAKRIEITIKFFEMIIKHHDERDALHKIKKFTGFFTKGVPGASKLRQKLNGLHVPADILEEMKNLTESLREARPCASAT
jgi:nifR3 family TIM-barrel protein